jgi:hypothetical protein
MFFSNENLSKLCAEGALNMLQFLPEDMNIFWGIGHIRFYYPHEIIE